jgi:hypothetical protein
VYAWCVLHGARPLCCESSVILSPNGGVDAGACQEGRRGEGQAWLCHRLSHGRGCAAAVERLHEPAEGVEVR